MYPVESIRTPLDNIRETLLFNDPTVVVAVLLMKPLNTVRPPSKREFPAKLFTPERNSVPTPLFVREPKPLSESLTEPLAIIKLDPETVPVPFIVPLVRMTLSTVINPFSVKTPPFTVSPPDSIDELPLSTKLPPVILTPPAMLLIP